MRERFFSQRNAIFFHRTGNQEKTNNNKNETIEGEFWEDK